MDKKDLEQSIWTLYINSQLLFKKAVNGRTILLGMTAEENQQVSEVMDKAIDDIAKLLEKRTTQHEAPVKKIESTTTVDVPDYEPEKEDAEDKDTKRSDDQAETADSKSVSKKTLQEMKEKKEEIKNGEGSWSSVFRKLKS